MKIKRLLIILSLVILVIVVIVGASIVWLELSSRDAASRAKSFCNLIQKGDTSAALAERILYAEVDVVLIETLEEKIIRKSKKPIEMNKLVSDVKSGYVRFRFYSNSPETFDCRVKVVDGKVESAEKFL